MMLILAAAAEGKSIYHTILELLYNVGARPSERAPVFAFCCVGDLLLGGKTFSRLWGQTK